MPKKKKGKETATPEFKFDYRYTPKPYFTAPTTSPISRPPVTKSSQLLRPRSTPNPDAWQAQKQRSYNYNRGLTYAKAATTTSSSAKLASASKAASAIEVTVTSADADTPVGSQKDQTAIKKSFEEMFRGRVDSSVIEVVLQNVNWNENEALDILSQMAPEDNSHLHNTLNPDAASASWFGAVTPDHNLTPTAPTLSYSSSITSLDEYGAEFTRDLTQRNLSQVADVLRNGPDDINDLDRQRLARSKATTPRSLLRNNTMTVKNISLGSTESLESNRSHYSHDPSGITYACASPVPQDTPKKTNFEKTVSLHDISTADDVGLVLSLPRDQASEFETTRSDPGTIESFLIPLDNGDIVLEKGTYDSQLNGASADIATPQPTSSAAGPLSHSASISDYSQAITSLTSQLHTDVTKDGGPAVVTLSANEQTSEPVVEASAVVTETEASNPGDADKAATYSQKLSAPVNKESNYPYDGLLGSGTTVPTAFESARPKKAKVSEVDEVTRPLQQTARSGEKVMFIVRGAPGSGKSTLARLLVEGTEGRSFSGDEFFMDETGRYNWQQHLLPEAHAWNQSRVCEALKCSVTPVVVDNTNLEVFEMEVYVKMCLQYGYRPILAEPNTPWRYKAKELFKRNTHHVPYAKIKQMLERFDHKVTVNQLMDIVTSKQPQLLSMADQMKAMSTKLSRRKPTSKTMKRNQLHDTIDKFKDKKVDELISSPSTPRQRPSHSVSGDEDNTGETTIMYPNAASLNALKRKTTIKVLNCDRPKSTASKKPADDSKGQKSADSSSSASSADKSSMQPKHKHSSKSECDVNSQSATDLVRAEKTADLSKTLDLAPGEATAKHENQLLPPAADTSNGLSIDKSTSMDTGLSRTRKDQSHASTHIVDQSNGREVDENELMTGSSTLPRASARGSVDDPVMSQSASLPRSKHKSKSGKKSTGKKTSASVLQADSAQIERWLSNDWAAPPYPVPSTSADVITSRSVPSSLMNASAASSAPMTSSVTVLTSSLASSIDPPPPYEEHDRGAAVSASDEAVRFEVKKKDGCTLTEPVDYAMAYKAMQHNHQLPEGWLLLSGHSKPPHPHPVGSAARISTLVTHDKGTIIAEGDLSMSRSSSQGDVSAPNTDGLEKLQSCFPQLSKEQLAEFLELCRGDSTWATNLLLDSNKVPLAKKSKRQAVSSLSIAGLNKRMVSKYKVGKSALTKRFTKAIVPVTGCLSKHEPPYSSPSSPQTISLQLTSEQANNLHALFGRGKTCPTSVADGEVRVDVPRWIAHKIYMCMVDNSSKDEFLSESPRLVDGPPVTPIRPPRRRRTATPDLSITADLKKESEPTAGADFYAVSADSALEESAAPPAYSQADEELARRLQTEDLMDVIKSRQQTPAQKFSVIADEEYARSLMAAEINGEKGEPDLSGRLKRQKLYELHPGLNKTFLDEVFNSFEYNLEQTLQFLSDHHDSDPLVTAVNGSAVPQVLMSSAAEDLSDTRERSPGTRESSPSKSVFVDGEDQWFDVEDYMANAEYQDFRAEANLHQKLRKECLDKANMANSKRKYGVSAYYAEKAEDHWQKWKEANMAAATQIFKSSNSHRSRDEVDLHGLHPDEAVCAVSEVIKLAKEEGKRKHLSIITGRGNRSKSGVSRVKRAVECFLDKNRMTYRMENPGMIKVTL